MATMFRTIGVIVLAVGLAAPVAAQQYPMTPVSNDDLFAAREMMIDTAWSMREFGEKFGFDHIAQEAAILVDTYETMSMNDFGPMAQDLTMVASMRDAAQKLEELEPLPIAPAVFPDLFTPIYPPLADCGLPDGARFPVSGVIEAAGFLAETTGAIFKSLRFCTDPAAPAASCDPFADNLDIIIEAYEKLCKCNAAVDAAEIQGILIRTAELKAFIDVLDAKADGTSANVVALIDGQAAIGNALGDGLSSLGTALSDQINAATQALSDQFSAVATSLSGQLANALTQLSTEHSNVLTQLSAEHTTIATALSTQITDSTNAILTSLTDAATLLSNQIATSTTAILDTLNTHDANIQAILQVVLDNQTALAEAIANHDAKMEALLNQVIDNQLMIKSHQLQTACWSQQPLPDVYLPNSLGGQLEQVLALASDTITKVNTTSDTNNVTINLATTLLTAATNSFNAGQYKNAYRGACQSLRCVVAHPDDTADECVAF